jgi:uncharacterized protein (DUF58 family)
VRPTLVREVSPVVIAATGVATGSVLAAVLSQRPYVLEVGVPAVLVLLVGLLLDYPAWVETRIVLEVDRPIEGDETEILVMVRGHGAAGRVVLELLPPAGLHYVPENPAIREMLLEDEWVEVRYRLDNPPWGVHRWGSLAVRVPSPLGLVMYETSVEVEPVLRVMPQAEAVELLARTSRTGMTTGSRLALDKGAGFEFADIRGFHTGDRMRDVNWRATARRGELRVNDRHPERSTDVVLLLDAFPSAALGEAVKAAASLATAYVNERDRVGVVRSGSRLDWLLPGMGLRQLYRIIDMLLEASAQQAVSPTSSSRWPRQALPANALVLAVTPMADPSAAEALIEIASQGLRLAVIAVGAEAAVAPGPRPGQRLAYEIWQLEMAEARDRLRDRGIPVVAWDTREPLGPVIEEVAAFQRYARNRTG